MRLMVPGRATRSSMVCSRAASSTGGCVRWNGSRSSRTRPASNLWRRWQCRCDFSLFFTLFCHRFVTVFHCFVTDFVTVCRCVSLFVTVFPPACLCFSVLFTAFHFSFYYYFYCFSLFSRPATSRSSTASPRLSPTRHFNRDKWTTKCIVVIALTLKSRHTQSARAAATAYSASALAGVRVCSTIRHFKSTIHHF